MNWSAAPVSSTFRAKFFSVSSWRRSRIFCEVTCFPSLPKKGELLMENSMLMVGLSISIVALPLVFQGQQLYRQFRSPQYRLQLRFLQLRPRLFWIYLDLRRSLIL